MNAIFTLFSDFLTAGASVTQTLVADLIAAMQQVLGSLGGE